MSALVVEDAFLFEGFRLDRRSGGLYRRDQRGVFVPVPIGSRALDVLGVLVAHAGELVSRDQIIAAAWPATVVEDNNLNMQIAALRRALDQGRAQSCIQTIPGRGYRFVAPVAVLTTASASSAAPSSLSTPPRLSIVVLPFANLSNDSEQQYFADAITEDLTTDLSRLAGMLVISRNTAFTYRDKSIDTKQIGRELGVRYVLDGSIRRSSDRVRVTAQLIDADTDGHLWAERFDGDTSDLFALQDEITRRIAIALNLELVRAEAARPTQNPDALDFVLRGRAAFLRLKTRDNYPEVIALFERALALEPRSVEAQSLLVTALTARVLDGMTDTAVADMRRAEELAKQALAESPRSQYALYAKGQVLRAQGRYTEAIPEYEAVLAFNRNWVNALHALGQCKFYAGLIDEDIPLEEQAIRLSPRDPHIANYHFSIGRVYLLQSHTDEAIVWLEKSCNANPEHPYSRAYLACAYALKGEIERAAAELADARRLSGDNRFSSLARLKAVEYFGVPKVRILFEATYFAGLRKAGMPQE